MSGASFCWHCGRNLVGKNGSKKPPLVFAEVEPQPGQVVRVHKACAQNARLEPITAQPAEIASGRPI